MFEISEIEDLDEITKERRKNFISVVITTSTTMILAYLNLMPLALGSLIIAIISHTNLRYWDTKRNIIKYSSKGGKNK